MFRIAPAHTTRTRFNLLSMVFLFQMSKLSDESQRGFCAYGFKMITLFATAFNICTIANYCTAYGQFIFRPIIKEATKGIFYEN